VYLVNRAFTSSGTATGFAAPEEDLEVDADLLALPDLAPVCPKDRPEKSPKATSVRNTERKVRMVFL
jgi:hypothetical protein